MLIALEKEKKKAGVTIARKHLLVRPRERPKFSSKKKNRRIKKEKNMEAN